MSHCNEDHFTSSNKHNSVSLFIQILQIKCKLEMIITRIFESLIKLDIYTDIYILLPQSNFSAAPFTSNSLFYWLALQLIYNMIVIQEIIK